MFYNNFKQTKRVSMLKVIVQEEVTGCGIASVANIVGKTYQEMKEIANDIDIYANDKSLWSDTKYVRKLLAHSGFKASANEVLFNSWYALPDLALLSIKYHEEDGINFWHWVVFKRIEGQPLVLDSASYLPSNIRVDFDDIQPKWYIEVNKL